MQLATTLLIGELGTPCAMCLTLSRHGTHCAPSLPTQAPDASTHTDIRLPRPAASTPLNMFTARKHACTHTHSLAHTHTHANRIVLMQREKERESEERRREIERRGREKEKRMGGEKKIEQREGEQERDRRTETERRGRTWLSASKVFVFIENWPTFPPFFR